MGEINLLKGEYVTSDYALTLNGISHQDIRYPIIVTKNPKLDQLALANQLFLYDKDYDYDNYIYEHDNGFNVPTVERSIIDAIRAENVTDENICMAIENYTDFHGKLEQLEEMAKIYNIEEKFRKYMEFYKEFMDDFFKY